MASKGEQIVPGITLSRRGEATVAPELSDVLFDLALGLEETTQLPVDVQHVLAAIVMAARIGELDANTPLSLEDSTLVPRLTKHVQCVFANHGGKVGSDD